MRFNLVVAALMLIASGLAQAATVAPPTPESAKIVGHLYMQSNPIANEIVHFARYADGTLAEVERVVTSGAGSRSAGKRARPMLSKGQVALS